MVFRNLMSGNLISVVNKDALGLVSSSPFYERVQMPQETACTPPKAQTEESVKPSGKRPRRPAKGAK